MARMANALENEYSALNILATGPQSSDLFPSEPVPGLSPVWGEWLDGRDLYRLTRHPLLLAFQRGEADMPTLETLLIQHHHYSRYFTRFLCALISNQTESEDVATLAQNLLEEMGAGSEDNLTHADLYRRSLKLVGVEPDMMPAFRETQELVRTMFEFCRSENPLDGLAALCLGAEAIVPLIYRPIITALDTLGFDEKAAEFFKLHVEEDEDHALDMLRIMERMTEGRPQERARAVSIGVFLIGKRAEFLDATWQHAQYLRARQA
jgi:pyrroloquinoline-quinone synthase